MKYIDVDKLNAALALHYAEITIPVITDEGGIESYFRRSEIHAIQKIIDSLQQEQPEWNEEDEDMYARVVRRYTDYEGVIMRTKEESVASKMLDAMAQEEIWLKSLRPQSHWKPSEEQMRALRYYINQHQGLANQMTSNWTEFEALKSLHNDLKKLM